MKYKIIIKEYFLITFSTLLIVAGVYFFKFTNNFTFGGVTGLSVVLGRITPLSPSTVNLILNILLLILGFMFLGKKFAIKTVYSSMLLSLCLSGLEHYYPMQKPLTDEPMLELVFAVAMPAFGSALLFNMDASSGGTDIAALILKKYTSIDIGRALFFSDLLITLSAFLVFDIKTALFSFFGLLAKSLAIDNVIESINLAKYFNVVCSNPEIICDYIVHDLNRSATVCDAQGAYSHKHKYIIFTAMRRPQAVQLRRFIKRVEPDAFILISNTSEIIGKGFHD
nr:YitT family protein [uncultured Caproiciproducens sp.]